MVDKPLARSPYVTPGLCRRIDEGRAGAKRSERQRPTRRIRKPLFGRQIQRLAIRLAFSAAPVRAPAYPRSSRRAEAPAKLARPARIAAR